MPPKEFSSQQETLTPTDQSFNEREFLITEIRPGLAEKFFPDEDERIFFEKIVGSTYKDVMNLVAADMASGEQMVNPAHRDEIFVHLLNNGYAPLPVDFPRDFKGSIVWSEMLRETQEKYNLPIERLVDLAEYSAGLTSQVKLNSMTGLDPVTRGIIEARRSSVRAIAERIFNGEEAFYPEEELEYQQGIKMLPIVFKSAPETESGSEFSFHSFGPGTPLNPMPAQEVRDKIAYIVRKYGIPPSM